MRGCFGLFDEIDVIVVTGGLFFFRAHGLFDMNPVLQFLCVLVKVFFVETELVGYLVLVAFRLEERFAVEIDILRSVVQDRA